MAPARSAAVCALCAWLLWLGAAAIPGTSHAQAPREAAAAAPAPHEQRRLLEQALAALAPRETGRINLYLLAVAGDGSQEVFRREVQFVQQQFAERFGMRGQTLTLVNSRTTLGITPIATRASLREALRAIAARMDTQEDVLFVYLTSHGSPRHELALRQPHMRLRDLPAHELRNLLRDSGIRWKVVVISACYSGGFIDAIKDEHTLVITAARRDRPSFGCADENDFTYFGRAYFKEALPRAQSFEAAFGKASDLVREWEDRDAKADGKSSEETYSYPQMHSAEPIARHLRRWWRQHGSAATD
jgi:Peptidase C13 family